MEVSSLLSLTESTSGGSNLSLVNADLWDILISEIVAYFSANSILSPTTFTPLKDPEESAEAIFIAVEALAFKVGVRLAEIHSIDKKKCLEPLDCVKFICKDFWSLVFKKNVDNLKTNHRDNNFRWLSNLSFSPSPTLEELRKAKMYLAFPVGLMRGVMFNLGFPSIVSVESMNSPPSCSFQISVSATNATALKS